MNDITITYADREPMTLAEFVKQIDNGGTRFFKYSCQALSCKGLAMITIGGLWRVITSGKHAGDIFTVCDLDRTQLIIPCDETGEPIEAGDEWEPLIDFEIGDIVETKEQNNIWQIESTNYKSCDVRVSTVIWHSSNQPEITLSLNDLARRVSLKIEVTVK